MTAHTHYLWFQTKQRQEIIDITDEVARELIAEKMKELKTAAKIEVFNADGGKPGAPAPAPAKAPPAAPAPPLDAPTLAPATAPDAPAAAPATKP